MKLSGVSSQLSAFSFALYKQVLQTSALTPAEWLRRFLSILWRRAIRPVANTAIGIFTLKRSSLPSGPDGL